MTEVLLLLAFPEAVRLRYLNGIRQKFPDLTVHLIDNAEKAEPYIGSTDVLITFGPMLGKLANDLFAKAAQLKWVQALGTGVDNIADRPALRRDVILTKMHGIHGAAVSEAAIAAMLALSREIPRIVRSQDQRKWDRFPARVLDGATVGILGVGAIAEALAPRCKALGMTVVGITSSSRTLPGFDHMIGRDQLLAAVRDLDHLVLLTPYSPETRHIVNAAVFDAMKPSAYLVNLARGGVVDEAALLEALRAGKIAGAALDVFETEPLPPEHPFWSLPNVIVTPHLGGFYDKYVDAALAVVETNLRKFLAGDTQTMINRVAR